MESVKEPIAEWIAPINGSGSGYGYGSGSGSGYGYGYGYGDGDGYGYGYGDGDGYGSGDGSGSGYGYGSGDGSGDGSGYGYGDGSGSGYGYGYGYGYGSGIKTFCGQTVYVVGGVQTFIAAIFGNYAKGAILNSDLTTTPCYIAKRNGTFAHGETIRKAEQALIEKLYDLEPLDERIDKFVETHTWGIEYPAEDFYSWHHILTGSCEIGRKTFAKDHGIDIEHDMMTVERFLALTENDYGGSIIKDVKERYRKENR